MVRVAARGLLLALALVCFVVAALGLSTTSSGRPVLTWMSAGLAFLTLALLVDLPARVTPRAGRETTLGEGAPP